MRLYKHKYGAKRAEHRSGFSFASKLEAAVFDMLKSMELAGEVTEIQCQDHVYLTDARILLIPDFKVFDVRLDSHVWIEAKGMETSDWRIKRRLWQHYGPGILRVYKGTYKNPVLQEEIKPK